MLPGTARATLIVCPDAIFKQWQAEVQRHAAPGVLKIIEYGGQSASLTSSLRGAPHPIRDHTPSAVPPSHAARICDARVAPARRGSWPWQLRWHAFLQL